MGKAERLARASAGVLERVSERRLLAEPLTTRGTAPALSGRREQAETLRVQILHAEDDEIITTLAGRALKEEGWCVHACADGAAVLREIEGGAHYDLIILDNSLPGASGLELASRARSLPHRRQVPIIMLSAGNVEREARSAGVTAFLRKPEDVPALTQTVARLLAREPKQS